MIRFERIARRDVESRRPRRGKAPPVGDPGTEMLPFAGRR